MILLLLLCSNTAFAAMSVRGGVRGSSVAIGIEDHNFGENQWMMGYGAEILTGYNTLLGYLSFNKIIGGSERLPIYLSFGPAVGASNDGGTVGGFAHIGFDNIFDLHKVFAEIGVDVMSSQNTGGCLEIGYRF